MYTIQKFILETYTKIFSLSGILNKNILKDQKIFYKICVDTLKILFEI